LAVGLLLLIGGAELLVRAAVRMAASLKVRPVIIGLSVVAFGSSAPQMAVSLQAAFSGAPDIAVSSVFGSNIFGVLVTLGLCSLIIPLRVSRQLVRLDIPLMIGASLLVFLLCLNRELGRLEGCLLLASLLVYLLLLRRQSRQHGRVYPSVAHLPAGGPLPWLRSGALFVGGLLMLGVGGHLVLDAVTEVALDFGLSDRILGLTVVAVCTSLPELFTSLIAAIRGERDIAVGNVIGSNLFNLLGVLGFTVLIAPAPLSISPNALGFDLPVMLGVAALCLPLFYSGYRITRAEGLVLLGLYLAYGLHVVAFTTGMPLASHLERLMLHYILPLLAVFVLVSTWHAWRRQS
jgi:cation:H+ antiporter